MESSRKVYLLYCRGVFGQCLYKEERALADLKEFLSARYGASMWASLIADAERRVRLLERKAGQSGPAHMEQKLNVHDFVPFVRVWKIR